MFLRLASIAGAFCAAMLPIAILSGLGYAVLEILTPSTTFALNVAETIQAALVLGGLAYLFGFGTSAPFFAIFRWGAGRLGFLTYRAASLLGGLTAICALARLNYWGDFHMNDLPFAGSPVMIFVQFAVIGMLSGILYWRLEQVINIFLRHRFLSYEELTE